MLGCFVCKQKTAYELRISDWSSDVCSSDLAAACGWLAERGWDRNVLSATVAMLVGNALIYLPGLLWLGVLFGWDKPILEWGLTPFLLGDLLKLALVAAGLPLAWRMISKRG